MDKSIDEMTAAEFFEEIVSDMHSGERTHSLLRVVFSETELTLCITMLGVDNIEEGE